MVKKSINNFIFLKGILILSIIFIVSQTLCAQSDNSRCKLHNMILNSDLIIWGEIVSIDYNSLLIHVHEVFKGKPDNDTIELNKTGSSCLTKRWMEYEAGQNAIYYLKKNAKSSHEAWDIYNSENEGEMPVEGGRVFISDRFFDEDSLLNMPTYKLI